MIFIGNLKNNITTDSYIKTLTSYTYKDHVGLVLPLVYIYKYKKILADAGIYVGAQCVDLQEDFANRGEISAEMLKDVGTDFVFLGHRMDRKLTLNDYARIRAKIVQVVKSGMKMIVSIGESLEDKEMGKTMQVLEKQIREIFKNIDPCVNPSNLIIAYEPKWAVGTGLSLNQEELEVEMRNILSIISAYAKDEYKVLYGGSCNLQNIPLYTKIDGISGFAISKASLDIKQFVRILCGTKKSK